MSLEDYNRHARLGPLAGLPRNASEMMGQAAYHEALKNAGGFNPDGDTYAPHAKTEPPHWMMHHAFKRGLAFFLVARVIMVVVTVMTDGARSGPAEVVNLICGLISIAGVILMFFGVLNFITRNKRSAG
jgi:hypothetical protein